MNTENTFAPGPDDIVFENRNKAYGAYTIRKSYESNLSRGSAISLLMIGFVLAAIQAVVMMNPEIVKEYSGPICGGLIPEPIVIADPRPPKQIPHQPKANANTPPRVVTTPVENTPPVETQATQLTGNTNATGGETTQMGGDAGALVAPITVVVPPQPQTLDFAQVMPEFEGGAKAMYKFLRKTLRYPKAASRIGLEGVVYVRFIIDVTGTVTGVEVIKSATGVLDIEASRVIGLMPKWKPGSQHGEPVNVRMVLPIKFELGNE